MPARLKTPILAGGAIVLIASLVGFYILVNNGSSDDSAKQSDSETASETSESGEALPTPPVEQIVEAFNAGDKDTLEQYLPEEFRGQEWTIEEVIGEGTFVVGGTSDPDNAISQTYEAWTESENGSIINEFELVIVYDGTQWLIANL